MTLIIGLKCSDGVVLGADGLATLGIPFGGQTAVQKVTKLRTTHKRLVLGTSGYVGLAQDYLYAISQHLATKGDKVYFKSVQSAKEELSKAMWPYAEVAYKRAAVVMPLFGPQEAIKEAQTGGIVGIGIDGGDAHLIEFTMQLNGCVANADLPYCSTGSGQIAADVFMPFVRGVLWPQGLPTVAVAELLIVWTLQHCIEAGAPGIGRPIQITRIVKEKDGSWLASDLEQDAIESHEEAIKGIHESIRRAVLGEPAPPTDPIPV